MTATLDDLRSELRALEEHIVDRVEARLKRQRPKGERRTRTPELVATLVPAPMDELAKARARSALAKLRKR